MLYRAEIFINSVDKCKKQNASLIIWIICTNTPKVVVKNFAKYTSLSRSGKSKFGILLIYCVQNKLK